MTAYQQWYALQQSPQTQQLPPSMQQLQSPNQQQQQQQQQQAAQAPQASQASDTDDSHFDATLDTAQAAVLPRAFDFPSTAASAMPTFPFFQVPSSRGRVGTHLPPNIQSAAPSQPTPAQLQAMFQQMPSEQLTALWQQRQQQQQQQQPPRQPR